jgi:hypothetical protein
VKSLSQIARQEKFSLHITEIERENLIIYVENITVKFDAVHTPVRLNMYITCNTKSVDTYVTLKYVQNVRYIVLFILY